MTKHVLVAGLIGVLITLALFGLALGAGAAGHEDLARLMFWQNTLLQSFVPMGNIGNQAQPVHEGSPLNYLAFLASFPLGFLLYGFSAYFALGAAPRRA